jgi:hypothetical protein
MDTCFIVFSHANTEEKENILNECLLAIKKTQIRIILASHLSVSQKNQDLCDYFIKDTDNLIIGEDDIFNNPSNITENIYSSIDRISNFRLETSVYKRSYQAGVFNLLINSLNLAKNLGFQNCILWDYDYILGNKSCEFIRTSVNTMEKNRLESISFQSRICNFNNDVLEKEIKSCYAVPIFLNVDKILSILPEKPLKSCKEYMKVSNLMIVEQWVKSKIIDNCDPKLEYWYDNYLDFLQDTLASKVDFQSENYLFRGLRSGIYFSNDLKDIIFFTNNTSKEQLISSLEIKDVRNNEIIYVKTHKTGPYQWSFSYIPSDIRDLSFSTGISVVETVIESENNKLDTFKYLIDSKNVEHVSKLKKYTKNIG